MPDGTEASRPRTLRLKVRTLRPSEHELVVPPELPVAELKDRLVELTGILHERQRLLVSGHPLQDGDQLWDRGVRDGHTIHLVERPEGAAALPPAMPQPAGAAPRQQAASGSPGAGARSDNRQVDPFSQLSQALGSMPGLNGVAQWSMPQHPGNHPVSISLTSAGGEHIGGGVFGFGMGQQPTAGTQLHQQAQQAAAAAQHQRQQQPATPLLSTVQNFIRHLSTRSPAAQRSPPPAVPYVLPEGRRQDSERWWFTAAQSVLENADLRPEVRRFIETSVAEALAAPPNAQASRQPAGAPAPQSGPARQQAAQRQDPRLATTVAVALGELLRQTGELWRDRSSQVLLTAHTALSQLTRPIRPGQPSAARVQLELANSQLFAVGALAWELSRMCSMLLPALSGTAALPLATGRSAFINAAGTAPIMPLRAQTGLLGGGIMGPAATQQQQPHQQHPPEGTTPVTIRLPNGGVATGYFTGDPPRQEDFMQQLQWLLGGQFGIPWPGEGLQQQPGQAGGQQPGRRMRAAGSGQAAGQHVPGGAAGGDVEMPDLVSDAGSSEDEMEAADELDYESEWEEAEEDEDLVAAAQAAAASVRPQLAEQGTQTNGSGLGPRSPSITITFSTGSPQMDMGGGWPFPGISAGMMPGAAVPGGSMAAGGGGAGAANLWQSLLLDPQLGAVQQELSRLVSTVVVPLVGEFISTQVAGSDGATGASDLVQTLSQRIAAALQPSLAAIQGVVQALAPLTQTRAGAGNAAPQGGAQTSAAGPTGGAADVLQPAQPASAADAPQVTGGIPASSVANGPAAQDDDDGQQWAYMPTTTVSAEITVEPVDMAGRPVDAGADAAGQAAANSSQSSNVMVALSASLPLIQQALAEAMRPPQQGSAAGTASTAGSGGNAARSQPAGQVINLSIAPTSAAQAPDASRDSGPAGPGAAMPAAAASSSGGAPPASGGSTPAGLGPASLQRPGHSGAAASSSQAPQPAPRGGISVGLGLPPRPTRAGGSAGRRSGTNGPGAAPTATQQPSVSAAMPPTGQLGDMLASMLGGGGGSGSTGAAGGGGFAQILSQLAASPVMEQLANSPSMQNAMHPLLDGGSGGQGAGQLDIGALMNQMGPVLAQIMGGAGASRSGNAAAASSSPAAATTGPASAASAPDLPNPPHSAPLPSAARASAAAAAAAAPRLGVDPSVERTIRAELSAEDAESWLRTMREDAQVMQQQSNEQRPLSSNYAAGSLQPRSSPGRLF